MASFEIASEVTMEGEHIVSEIAPAIGVKFLTVDVLYDDMTPLYDASGFSQKFGFHFVNAEEVLPPSTPYRTVKIQDMSATTDRDIAMRVAETDFKKSLILAREVSEPWFRCQALAGTARYAPEEHVVQIAEEAIAVSLTETEPYMKVAATAWPLRALIERNQEQKAIQLLPEILALSSQIENPKGRSDALFMLWEAFFPSCGHESILAALIASCTGHSKAGYVLRRVVLILASEDIDEARKLASSMPEGNYKRQAEKRLAEGHKEQVREFFYKKTSVQFSV